MTSWLTLSLRLLLSWMYVTRGEFVERPRDDSLRSVAEEETVLPCRFQPTDSVVVQVTWFKQTSDGWEQIITAHRVDGQTAFGTWSGRVRFKSSNPTVDSSLVVLSTEVSDEGRYKCHVNSYPFGTFDQEVTLTVWTIPISSLDAVTVVEGQSYRQAASCRSLARPPPLLSWDTELSGQSVNRSWENGAVTAHYSLHPLRSMNGKKLDCLVWHPTLTGPRRHQNQLVVHFPPDSEVSGYSGDWYVGLERAALSCVSGGNPRPQLFTWARLGEALPEGAIPHPNGTLEFGRPLSLSDGGTYRCVAKNDVGVGAAELQISVTEFPERQTTTTEKTLMVVVGVVAGGLLILMLIIIITVTCHQKKKNKMLTRELTEKKEEISTLSRQASFRRMNSVSTDARGATEESIPLRVDGTLSSLGELAHSRESHSTLSGGRWAGGEGAYDYLGRPVLLNSRKGREGLSERDEESRLRVETYVRNNSLSLGTRLPPHVPTPSPILQSGELLGQTDEGASRSASATVSPRHSSRRSYPPVTHDDDGDEEDDDDDDEVDEGLGGRASREHPDDRESQSSRSQASEAHSAGYRVTNGTVRFKPGTNPTVVSPHASLVHKAQIV
ncbi:nectin-4 isoform X2 [Phyllopteryx taeniolatus]|uniref:nectin-4 isoform X2 n=1 Tax=Phyllopteryx taeniolatus TaxID=161469 RepID=UPI002AD3DE9A|nr:nectin-4 isoform X2 [Phyllopteryx taeniolatus]